MRWSSSRKFRVPRKTRGFRVYRIRPLFVVYWHHIRRQVLSNSGCIRPFLSLRGFYRASPFILGDSIRSSEDLAVLVATIEARGCDGVASASFKSTLPLSIVLHAPTRLSSLHLSKVSAFFGQDCKPTRVGDGIPYYYLWIHPCFWKEMERMSEKDQCVGRLLWISILRIGHFFTAVKCRLIFSCVFDHRFWTLRTLPKVPKAFFVHLILQMHMSYHVLWRNRCWYGSADKMRQDLINKSCIFPRFQTADKDFCGPLVTPNSSPFSYTLVCMWQSHSISD